ncbi:MAG: peptidase S41, partial [Candidatus Aminicenantes bacterium]|nr:peptidase S41 [Candidatus Aminicenantes bacterium]
RFFYPGDEAAALDWERFAVYGVKRVEGARSDAELKAVLEELFLPVAPALKISAAGMSAAFTPTGITPPDADKMKTVGWQHQGYGFGVSNAVYQSVRLNRKTPLASEETFGTITQCLDATPFRGGEIRLRAAAKAVAGSGQVWLRVDRESDRPGFFDNMGDRPVRVDRWGQHEITGPVASDATQVCFGFLLSGAGEVYADDFRISARKAGNEAWQDVPVANAGFEDGAAGQPPARWSARKMRNYSFLVAASDAREGAKSVCVKSRVDFISGPLPFFSARPKIGDAIAKDIGSGLSCLMPIALYGSDAQTYPPAPAEGLSRLKAALEAVLPKNPAQVSGDDLHIRLADIVIAWNVFRHFYPYFDVVPADWPAALTEALNAASADKTRWDFLKTLRRFTAELKDGHVRVSLQGSAAEDYALPLDWEWIEDSLVVTKILDPALSAVHAGDVVKTCDGVPAREALAREARYISAATPGWLRYRSLAALRTGEKDRAYRLEVENGSRTRPVELRASLSARQHRERLASDAVKSKALGGGVYYLNLDRISWEEISALMPELQKAAAVICDLRGYPNGNHLLIGHLLKKADTSRWMGIPQIIRPDFEEVEYHKIGWFLAPRQPALSARMIFLCDGRAISYAESFLGYIEGYKLATIIGQPTAGTNGNVNTLSLPGGYTVSWTGMRVEKIDGGRHHGVGIVPDIAVERTIRGVRAGRDEFLEKALAVARR